jgi:hypothetical protein
LLVVLPSANLDLGPYDLDRGNRPVRHLCNNCVKFASSRAKPAQSRFQPLGGASSVGQSRTADFIADNPGDWAFHCHITHHVMNQMGHAGPNMIGVNAAKV